MEFLIHEFSALYSILKAPNGPTVGAKISRHALHVLKTALYTVNTRLFIKAYGQAQHTKYGAILG